jgi:hypothetical protein
MAMQDDEAARRERARIAKRLSDRTAFEAWLKKQSREVCVAIAARAALRALPALALLADAKGTISDRRRRDIILPVFRGMAAPWAAAKYPARGAELGRAAARAARAARAADAAYAAADAAAHAAAAAAAAVARAAAVADARAAAAADAALVETNVTVAQLMSLPLWPNETPDWARSSFQELARSLHASGEDWDVWTRWYDAILAGEDAFIEEVEVFRVVGEGATDSEREAFWKSGAKVVNAAIKAKEEEWRDAIDRLDEGDNQQSTNSQPPVVPPQAPAAIAPKLENDKLSLPRKAVDSRLKGNAPSTSLKALGGTLHDLIADMSAETNVDPRMIARLRRLSERMPPKPPPQEILFSLGHEIRLLEGLRPIVREECSKTLSAGFDAFVDAMDQTWQQFPAWRELKAQPSKEPVPAKKAAEVVAVANELEAALQQTQVKEHVDPALPEAIKALAAPLQVETERPLASSDDPLEPAKQELIADVLESVSNTLKPVAEAAMHVGHGVAETGAAAAREYGKEASKSFIDEAREQGRKDGRLALVWTRRLLLTTVTTGGMTLAQYLSGAFPEYFGWLTAVITFLGTVTVMAGKDAIANRRMGAIDGKKSETPKAKKK